MKTDNTASIILQKKEKLNEMKKCKVKGCPNKRYRLYSFCIQHFWRDRDYGSPLGRAISAKEMKPYKEKVRSLYDMNPNHKGVEKATLFFKKWMLDAHLDAFKTVASRHFKRLYDAQVDPRELVITCAATYLYAYNDPEFPHNREALTKSLAAQMFKLIKRENMVTRNGKRYVRSLSSGDRRAIGEHIQKHLGILFVHTIRAVEQMKVNKLNLEQELQEDFRV